MHLIGGLVGDVSLTKPITNLSEVRTTFHNQSNATPVINQIQVYKESKYLFANKQIRADIYIICMDSIS